MDGQQLRQLKPELDSFLDSFAPLFGRDENQAHARRLVQGLLHKGERRNIENIAEALDGGPVRSLQAFVTTGAWHDQALLAELRCQALAVLADEDAVWNSDETGFPKKGAKSVGVKRQYSGTLGRTDNCQIGVFANYASSKGHTIMDRRLFLPEEWADDAGRRAEAGVPEDVLFRTKPALALEMAAQAVAERHPLPLGRRRQCLRRQPHLRAGRACVGQVVCVGHRLRHAGMDRATPGHPGGRAAASAAWPSTHHAVGGRRAATRGRDRGGPSGDGLATRRRGRRQSGAANVRIR